MKYKMFCSAVINNTLVENSYIATTEKQAWFFFSRQYGYRQRDFKIIGKIPVGIKVEEEQEDIQQLCFL